MHLHVKLRSAEGTVLTEKVDRALIINSRFMYSLYFTCFWLDKYLSTEVLKRMCFHANSLLSFDQF
jgi:hypothetical protein